MGWLCGVDGIGDRDPDKGVKEKGMVFEATWKTTLQATSAQQDRAAGNFDPHRQFHQRPLRCTPDLATPERTATIDCTTRGFGIDAPLRLGTTPPGRNTWVTLLAAR